MNVSQKVTHQDNKQRRKYSQEGASTKSKARKRDGEIYLNKIEVEEEIAKSKAKDWLESNRHLKYNLTIFPASSYLCFAKYANFFKEEK